MNVRSIGVLYTADKLRVPPGSLGRLRQNKYTDADGRQFVVVNFEQGQVRCAPWRVHVDGK